MKKLFLISAILLSLTSFAFAGNSSSTFMLRNPGWIYTRDGDNLLWKGTVDIGTEVGGPYDEFVPANVAGTKNTNKTPYSKINYEGEECWTLSGFLSFDTAYGEVRVVKDDAPVFTVNNIGSMEGKRVPAGTVVLMLSGEEESGLVPVEYFSTVFYKVIKAYMLKKSLSSSDGDYEAVILTNAALQKDIKKYPNQKEQVLMLLSEAEASAESRGIVQFVADAKAPIIGKDISNSPVSPVVGVSTGTINSNGSRVNVRQAPGKSSKAVGQLEDGTRIDIEEKTDMQETIAGETASWLKVTSKDDSSLTGWIFGSSVKWDEP